MLRRFSLTVKRFRSVSVSGGVVSNPQTSTFSIKASVQPVGGDVVSADPSLRIDAESYYVYTSTQLFTAKEAEGNSDIVTVFGKDFEVMQCENWQNGIISHYKAVIQR